MFINSFLKTSQRCSLFDILRDVVVDVGYKKEKGFSVNFGGNIFIYPDGVVAATTRVSIMDFTS